MKLCALILLVALTVPVHAAPVHVALKSAAAVQPDGDGFFTLGSVADLSGGETSARARLAGVLLGRAPLSGETRRLTRGDLALKLRQAGCDPNTQTVLEGAAQADVTTQNPGLERPGYSEKGPPGLRTSAPEGLPSTSPALPGPGTILIHRGAAVTILIQTGALTITATGVARDDGGAGDTIHVHRDGVMTDLSVTVLDPQRVQLEI